MLQALDAAHQAVDLDPALAAARFNLALAFEKASLHLDAKLAWGALMRLEPRSNWLDEASVHLTDLARPSAADHWADLRPVLERASLAGDAAVVAAIVEQHPWRALRFAEEEALPEFFETFSHASEGKADRQSMAPRTLGAALARRGEPVVLDTLQVVAWLARPDDRLDLLAAYQNYTEAIALCLANQGQTGEKLLAHARRVFRRLRLPLQEHAAYASALCAYQRTEYRQAVGELRQLVGSRPTVRYPSLLGRSQWLLGLAHQSLGEPEAALEAYRAAASSFAQLGAKPVMQHLIAESLVFMGDPWAAWPVLFQGLHAAVQDGEVRRRYSLMDKAAEAAEHGGFHTAALDFRSEVTRLARMEPDASGLTHAYLKRAEAHLALGRPIEAAADLTRAERESLVIPDANERQRRAIDLLLARGRVEAQRAPRVALRHLSTALALCFSTSFRMPLVDIHLARARVLRRMERADEAEEALLSGVEEFERGRKHLGDAATRMSYFERARQTFEELIDLRAKRPEGAESAFAAAEQMRARVILDHAMGASAEPSGSLWATAALSSRLRELLPEEVAVLSYASLPGRVVMWAARRGRPLRMATVEVGAAQLEHDVGECRRSMLNDETRATACLERLHATLVAPLRAALDSSQVLVVVPDGALHSLPFAALLRGAGQRHVIEDWSIVVYPSAAVLLHSLSHPPSTPLPSTMRLLALSDPALAPQWFADLGSLPGGRREGEMLRALFGTRARVLTGPDATLPALEAGLLKVDVVHVGAHSIAARPGRSENGLALAGRNTLVGPDELGRLQARAARLVVLGGCATGLGRRLGSEGVLSVARAFQVAGAPSVVANLWSINDGDAPQFYQIFYQALGKGASPGEALRSAQLTALRRARANGRFAYRTWAAGVAFGTWWRGTASSEQGDEQAVASFNSHQREEARSR